MPRDMPPLVCHHVTTMGSYLWACLPQPPHPPIHAHNHTNTRKQDAANAHMPPLLSTRRDGGATCRAPLPPRTRAQVDPGHVPARTALGCLVMDKELMTAERYFQEATGGTATPDPATLNLLGEVFWRRTKTNAALAQFYRMKGKQERAAEYQQGATLWERKAMDMYQRVAQINPSDSRALAAMAQIFLGMPAHCDVGGLGVRGIGRG